VDAFFLDSSAIVKRYVNETGSNFIESLTDVKSGNVILLARITQVEFAAAIARRLKGASITTTDAQNALAAFQKDLINAYFTVEIAPVVLSAAVNLCTKYALRGYDAVQLAALLEANNERVSTGLAPLKLVSADTELNHAAQLEGLTIENPNAHP
jgi:predicted nucleic acid-binding protein